MTKSDLRTGMLVTLRNLETYYVLLNTGLSGKQGDILAHNCGDDTGWMPLSGYHDDLTYHDDDPDDIFADILAPDPEVDREWDIMKVSAPRGASAICNRKHYKTVWERGE